LAERRVFGPGRHTLLSDGRALGPVEVADTSATRRRGLLGTDAIDGALWITRCPSVHMVGMRFPIDIAVLDRDGAVLRVKTIKPWTGGTWFTRGAVATVEASAGAMTTWGVVTGCVLSVG
jgi:uncharacterized membrane protein (UPF0127 family)